MPLIEDKKYYKIKDREFFIQEFSLEQTDRLLKFIGKIFQNGTERFKDIESGKSNEADIEAIISLIDLNEKAELLAICLNTYDIEFVKDNIKLKMILNIISDTVELNDFVGIVKNSSRTVKMIRGLLKNLKGLPKIEKK